MESHRYIYKSFDVILSLGEKNLHLHSYTITKCSNQIKTKRPLQLIIKLANVLNCNKFYN